MLENIKERVLKANLELVAHGLVVLTWGNVSAIDRGSGLIVIKPSGVDYARLKAEDMSVVDAAGNLLEGLKPSSDTPTHLELYAKHPDIGGVVHTHSVYATAFAQAGREIPAYGTTHADCFYGSIPCTAQLTESETSAGYERNTGVAINRAVAADALAVPACLVRNHGVFAWGRDAESAVCNAVTAEYAAKMAVFTELLNADAQPAPQYLLDKHYFRKHGANAYYGQGKGE